MGAQRVGPGGSSSIRKESDGNGKDGHGNFPSPIRPFFPLKLNPFVWGLRLAAQQATTKASSSAPVGHSIVMEVRVGFAFIGEDLRKAPFSVTWAILGTHTNSC